MRHTGTSVKIEFSLFDLHNRSTTNWNYSKVRRIKTAYLKPLQARMKLNIDNNIASYWKSIDQSENWSNQTAKSNHDSKKISKSAIATCGVGHWQSASLTCALISSILSKRKKIKINFTIFLFKILI